MKKLLVIIVVLISIFTVSGCTRNNSDALKFKEEYEALNNSTMGNTKYEYPTVNVDKDNPIKYADVGSLLEVLNNGTGIIYLGYPDCPWCRNVVPVLLECAKELEIEDIYYMNMKDERDLIKVKEDGSLEVVKEGTEGYKKLLTRLDVILDEYTLTDVHGNTVSANEKRIYVPLVIFVKDGEIVGYHVDTVKSQTNPLEPLNEEQKNELMDIYINYMHKVLGDVCDSSC